MKIGKLERAKAEIVGQLSLEDEAAAVQREARDDTDAPTDIAAFAAERVKAGD
jgi:hypothetical protein